MIAVLKIDTNIYIILISVLFGVVLSLLHSRSGCFQEKSVMIITSYLFAGLSATNAFQNEYEYLMLYGVLCISYACVVKENDSENSTTAAFITLIVILMCLVVTNKMGRVFLIPCLLVTSSALSLRMKNVYVKPRISFPPPSFLDVG